jgi:hypothetical protein
VIKRVLAGDSAKGEALRIWQQLRPRGLCCSVSWRYFIPIRDLTWNIGTKNHGPAMQVRGTPAREMVSFLGVTDLGTRSVLERISVQNHFFESELVSINVSSSQTSFRRGGFMNLKSEAVTSPESA